MLTFVDTSHCTCKATVDRYTIQILVIFQADQFIYIIEYAIIDINRATFIDQTHIQLWHSFKIKLDK